MNFAGRMLRSSGREIATAGAVPLLTALVLIVPAYAPVWGLAHWILRNDEGHHDTPTLLLRSAGLVKAPVRMAEAFLRETAPPHRDRQGRLGSLTAGAAAQMGLIIWAIIQFIQAEYIQSPWSGMYLGLLIVVYTVTAAELILAAITMALNLSGMEGRPEARAAAKPTA